MTDKKLSGQQLSEINAEKFKIWVDKQGDVDFKQLATKPNGGLHHSLNRKNIADECGFGKSVLYQNPEVKHALEELEKDLALREVIPKKAGRDYDLDDLEKPAPREYDQTSNDSRRGFDRASDLESVVIALQAENEALRERLRASEERLDKLGELSEVIAEIGMLPQ